MIDDHLEAGDRNIY